MKTVSHINNVIPAKAGIQLTQGDSRLRGNDRKISAIFAALAALAVVCACSDAGQFASYQREFIGETEIGKSVTKKIVLQNTNLTDVQHISGLNFDAGYNTEGHFRIDKVEVGGVVHNPKNEDITVPAGSIVEVYVTYQPLNMDTTAITLGGWTTGEKPRYEPLAPEEVGSAAKTMKALFGGKAEGEIKEEKDKAIHRAIVAAVYDYPQMGILQLEVVGEAKVGADGSTSAAGGSSGECPSDAGMLCYTGGFAIEMPDIMTGGAKQLKMTAPAVFKTAGSNVSIDMGTFPAVLLVLKGNGPGEPLEGKPINAISIVISGAEGVEATGTFDGSNLTVNKVAFRIRVVLGEITEKDITPGLQASVDFSVKELELKTTKPYTNGSIGLMVDATLPAEPSGNPTFDQFLGNARVVVTMNGTMAVQ
jgi:hypothetical protein